MEFKANHTVVVVIGHDPVRLIKEGKVYKKPTLQKLYQFFTHRFKRIDEIDVLNKIFQEPNRFFTFN